MCGRSSTYIVSHATSGSETRSHANRGRGGLCAGPARVRAEAVDLRPRGLGVFATAVLGASSSRMGDSGAELAAERLLDLLPVLVAFVGVEVREGGRSGSGNCLGWWRVETMIANCFATRVRSRRKCDVGASSLREVRCA